MLNLKFDSRLEDIQFADDGPNTIYRGTFFTETEHVLRFDWRLGLFRLQFSADPNDWDMRVANAGNAYWNYDHGNRQLGNVTSLNFQNLGGHFEATMVEATDPFTVDVQNNIRNKKLKGLSMEVNINKLQLMEKDEEKGDLFKAIDQRFNGIASLMRPAFKMSGMDFGSANLERNTVVLQSLINGAYADQGEVPLETPRGKFTLPSQEFMRQQAERIVEALTT